MRLVIFPATAVALLAALTSVESTLPVPTQSMLRNSLGTEMRFVSDGEFGMGSPIDEPGRLFNLKDDPQEQVDLSAESPALARRLADLAR